MAGRIALRDPQIECPHCDGTGVIAPAALDHERIRKRFDDKWLPDLRGPFGCWIWVASLNADGYGQMTVGTRHDGSKGPIGAHVVAYELYIGPVPEGLVLDHAVCQLPPCVNPWHLEPVTSAENTLRAMQQKNWWGWRRALTHCPHGHPYAGENLYMRPDGARGCKACNRESARKYQSSVRSRRRSENLPFDAILIEDLSTQKG